MSSRDTSLRDREARLRTLGAPRASPASRRPRRGLVLLALVLLALAVVIIAPTVDKVTQKIVLPLQHTDIIRQQAKAKRLDPALIAAVIYAETKFVPRTSPAGAEGLMQILPATASFLAHRSGGTAFTEADLATPQVNISYGSYYLRYLLDRYGQQTVAAVAAYNGGGTNVNRWIARAGGHPGDLRAADIPFTETRAYVKKVLGAQREYRRSYARELGLGPVR